MGSSHNHAFNLTHFSTARVMKPLSTHRDKPIRFPTTISFALQQSMSGGGASVICNIAITVAVVPSMPMCSSNPTYRGDVGNSLHQYWLESTSLRLLTSRDKRFLNRDLIQYVDAVSCDTTPSGTSYIISGCCGAN